MASGRRAENARSACTLHQPRSRRAYLGELVQIDGCLHRWFETRGPQCTALVFIDDATSRLMELRFARSETIETIALLAHAADAKRTRAGVDTRQASIEVNEVARAIE